MFQRGISHTELLLFTKHLGMMTKTGLTLAPSLTILYHQARGRFRKILEQVLKKVRAGRTLADALREHPGIFSSLYQSVVEIGETSGTLSRNLEQLSSHLEKTARFKKMIQAAMVYPVLVLSVTLGLGFLLSTVVLPQITRVFRVLNAELPPITRVVLAAAGFLQHHGWWFLPAIIGGVLVLLFLLRQKWMAPLWHPVLLSLPLVGALTLDLNRTQFCRSLGLLLSSGIPLADALDTLARAAPNVVFSKSITATRESILRGQPLAGSMERHRRLFPQVLTEMLGVGEKSGTLDQTLFYLADFYDDQVDTTTRNLTTLIEPVLLLVIGAIVGTVALAILLPIWSVTSAIQ